MSYYTTGDYYLEGQELAGHWRDDGAKRLGLAGEVNKEDWDALCNNRDPATGKTLTLRQNENRRVGYDFNFHVPKSVSVLYSVTKDDRILDAFRESVADTMREIETEAQTRVRKAGKNEKRVSGNIIYGEFVHLTSRPVDGVPDPHLHAHCFVFNATRDSKEKAWKAIDISDFKRDAPYFEARFHSRMARRMCELGVGLEDHLLNPRAARVVLPNGRNVRRHEQRDGRVVGADDGIAQDHAAIVVGQRLQHEGSGIHDIHQRTPRRRPAVAGEAVLLPVGRHVIGVFVGDDFGRHACAVTIAFHQAHGTLGLFHAALRLALAGELRYDRHFDEQLRRRELQRLGAILADLLPRAMLGTMRHFVRNRQSYFHARQVLGKRSPPPSGILPAAGHFGV